MLSPPNFADAFARNTQSIKLQAANLSQAESLLQLPYRGNCMNWIIGHVIANRLNVLKLLEAEPDFDHTGLERYQRESDPITPESSDVLPLSTLITMLEKSQEQLARLLADATSAALERQVAFFGNRSQAVIEWIFFFYLHNCYHPGQTEILRQATGKNDKIIYQLAPQKSCFDRWISV